MIGCPGVLWLISENVVIVSSCSNAADGVGRGVLRCPQPYDQESGRPGHGILEDVHREQKSSLFAKYGKLGTIFVTILLLY